MCMHQVWDQLKNKRLKEAGQIRPMTVGKESRGYIWGRPLTLISSFIS